MAFDPFKRHGTPSMSLGERVARDKGIYPDTGNGWDIPFMVYYAKRSLDGYLLANHVRHITGVPGTFLVYWELRFRGVIHYTSDGWEMTGGHDRDLVYALGQWIVLYYQ